MTKHKRLSVKRIGLSGFLPCLIVSVVILIALVALAALVAAMGSYRASQLGIFSFAALILSAGLSGGISARICGNEGRLRITLLCPFTVVLIMLLISVISGASPSLSMLMNYLCYTGIFLLSAMLLKPGKRRGRKHR